MSFELHDTITAEHMQFVELFAARYDLASHSRGNDSSLSPPKQSS